MAGHLTIGLVFAALVWALPTGVAAQGVACATSVQIDGEHETVAAVRAGLAAAGTHGPQPGCATVSVRVTRVGEAIDLTATEPGGRTFERRVRDVRTATALIESWLALGGPAGDDAGALGDGATPDDEALALGVRPSARADRPLHRETTFSAGVSAAAARGSDGSLWFDLTFSGCVPVEPLCLGGLLRAAFDTAAVGPSQDLATERMALSAWLVAELPLRAGPLSLSPGLGVGFGWQRSFNDVDVVGVETEDVDLFSPRLEGHTRLGVPLGDALSLTLDVSGDVAVLGHGGTYQVESVTLAGAPRGFVRTGLGLVGTFH